jgi:hypothetical protein
VVLVTAHDRKPRAARPPALQRFDEERALVLAEYRRRERQAPGSGNAWIDVRTELLRQARLEEASRAGRSPSALHTPLSMAAAGDGPNVHVGTPARTRARGGRFLSSLAGGGERSWTRSPR